MDDEQNQADETDEKTGSFVVRSEGAKPSDFCLVVLDSGYSTTLPLPPRGIMTLGRSGDCDVVVPSPSVSRQHVRIVVGPTLQVEDLGSRNGTWVGARRLEPGAPAELQPGETVEVGSVNFVVVARGAAALAASHMTGARGGAVGEAQFRAFDSALREACGASEGVAPFAVVVLRADSPGAVRGIEAAAAAAFGRALRVAAVLPEEHRMLVAGVCEGAEKLVSRVSAELERRRLQARVGVAMFPADGRTPASLLARARALADAGGDGRTGIVVRAPAMQRLYHLVDRVAESDLTILIVGETGVGKEIVARAVHERSGRRGKPFFSINCAALPESLAESELFGHQRGAFTGAHEAKPGLFEAAAEGTVLLDEVGELPVHVQAKLLRALEERSVLPVGGVRPRPIDVRFLAATNSNLERACRDGSFRPDLFFRLGAVSLAVPPLRERISEIEPLARLFVAQAAASFGRRPPDLGADTLDSLVRYHWPGNIRQLQNVLRGAVLLAGEGSITPDHLPRQIAECRRSARAVETVPRSRYRFKARATTSVMSPICHAGVDADRTPPVQASPDEERERVIEALARCGGNQTKAACMLGVSRRTLINRLETFGLPRPRKGQEEQEDEEEQVGSAGEARGKGSEIRWPTPRR